MVWYVVSLVHPAKTAPKEIVLQSLSSAALVPGVDVSNDVLYLYEHVLLGYPESELVELAT